MRKSIILIGSIPGAILGAVYVVGLPLLPLLSEVEEIELLVSGVGLLFLLNLVLGYIVFFLLDRGHILSGSYRQDEPAGGAARARAAA